MIQTVQDPLTHRLWFVPGVVAWGLPGLDEIEFVVTEDGDTDRTVLYGSATPGGAEQTVLYQDLVDHRGNHLPAELASPRVITRPKGALAAFVVGRESAGSFRLARDPSATDPVETDLLVIEMGD